ncbi:MAG: hypothetical protein JWL75_783, partial [Parcubacteria group bacterium]|nr:hypothetical protein [Parcubacteria group bacterium]
ALILTPKLYTGHESCATEENFGRAQHSTSRLVFEMRERSLHLEDHILTLNYHIP